MIRFSSTLKQLSELFQKCILLNAASWLRILPGIPFSELMEKFDNIKAFLDEEIDDHLRAAQQPGYERDFIDIYISEINRLQEAGQSNEAFQRKHLRGTLLDFFNAGVETTENTLKWGLVYASLWPEIQHKVQDELDSVIGQSRLPIYSDRTSLPYTEAFIMETHRFSTLVPFSVPHECMKNTKLMGYDIPKGTMVLQNIWAIHNDPNLWGDPEVFRPERFIDKEGKVQKPEYLVPFSMGARMCLGEPLARMELFLVITNILHRFSLHTVTGEKPPELEPTIGILSRPKSFSLVFRSRY